MTPVHWFDRLLFYVFRPIVNVLWLVLAVALSLAYLDDSSYCTTVAQRTSLEVAVAYRPVVAVACTWRSLNGQRQWRTVELGWTSFVVADMKPLLTARLIVTIDLAYIVMFATTVCQSSHVLTTIYTAITCPLSFVIALYNVVVKWIILMFSFQARLCYGKPDTKTLRSVVLTEISSH